MVDRRSLFVGSLNLDPRSVNLNTEMGLAIESEALCRLFGERFEAGIAEVAWRVELDAGRLVWSSREGRTDLEPGMGAFQSLLQGLLKILPVESQL
jgi:putative cardiolipin synthase